METIEEIDQQICNLVRRRRRRTEGKLDERRKTLRMMIAEDFQISLKEFETSRSREQGKVLDARKIYYYLCLKRNLVRSVGTKKGFSELSRELPAVTPGGVRHMYYKLMEERGIYETVKSKINYLQKLTEGV